LSARISAEKGVRTSFAMKRNPQPTKTVPLACRTTSVFVSTAFGAAPALAAPCGAAASWPQPVQQATATSAQPSSARAGRSPFSDDRRGSRYLRGRDRHQNRG